MSFNKRILSPGGLPFVNNENFRTVLYTGNGGTQSITGVGFQPDMVWLKNRSQNSYAPRIFDSTRGATKRLQSSSSSAESTDSTSLTSFDSDGFTLGSDNYVNNNGDSFVAWCFKASAGSTSSNSNGSITSTVQANPNAGFSIVKYTGSGSSASVGHGLASAPKLIFNKRISESQDWLAGALDWTKYLEPNGTPPFRTANVWTNSAPTSTTFGVINSTSSNSVEYINYCWADVAGYQKIDSYEGNGSTNGPVVNVGFEPALVMVKNVDSTDNWLVFDNKRNTTNPRTKLLQWNLSNAEGTEAGAQMNFYSNGFQSVGEGGGAGSGQINANGDTYLYLAIAANPDEESPTLASSFNIETYTGTNIDPLVVNSLGFSPGFVWIKVRDASREHILSDIVRGPDKELSTNATDAEESRGVKSFDSNGFTLDNSTSNYNHDGENYVAWTWKANDNEPTYNTNGSINSIVSANDNAGFSIVSYVGDGNSARTVGHGLSAKCDLVIIKDRDSADKWPVQLPQLGDNARMVLEATAGKTDELTTAQAGNETVFGIGGDNAVNKDGDRYIAYCFRNVTGYQKIGSYTGDGNNDRTITTGFKPDFILIKSTVGNDNWRLYDTKRGITGGGYLEPNRTDADDTSNAPNLTITSTGFTITSGGVTAGNNANGNLYFYWAIAKNVPSNTTLADSFGISTWTGNDNNSRAITGYGFRPDFVWIKRRNSAEPHAIYDSLRGENKQLESNSTSTQATNSTTYMGLPSFDTDGFSVGNNGGTNRASNTYVGWAWKAGNQWQSNIDGDIHSTVNANTANGFSIVKYHGNSASSATIGHGLSSAPQLIITKALNFGAGWPTQYNDGSNAYYGLRLNETGANDTSNGNVFYANTAPTSSVYTVGGSDEVNDDYDYISYCFHSVSGYSKIGTYTGNSSSGHSITGLGFQPDFVMIKRVDDNCSGSAFWFMFDSVRGAQYYLRANGNNAQSVAADATLTSFDSDGFTVGNDGCLNTGTMIYMAFKIN